MRFGFGRTSLPLGADIGRESVSLVRAEVTRTGLVVRDTETRIVPRATEADLDLKVAETVRSVLADFATRERRCVLAAPAAEVAHRTFRVPPGMRRREAERAALLEADSLVPWPETERLVALDGIPGREDEMLLSVAHRTAVARLISIARAGGLKPIAVDLPVCAWRRAIPDTDALLDDTRERAELVIFGDAIGTLHAFPPRPSDERLATLVRACLVEARRDGLADVRRLSILAPAERFESLATLLRDEGYAVVPVTCGTAPSPSWAFAFGLATWSIAPLGLHVS